MAWIQEEKTTNLYTSQQTQKDTRFIWVKRYRSFESTWIFSPIVVQKILYQRRALALSDSILIGQSATFHTGDKESRTMVPPPSFSLAVSLLSVF